MSASGHQRSVAGPARVLRRVALARRIARRQHRTGAGVRGARVSSHGRRCIRRSGVTGRHAGGRVDGGKPAASPTPVRGVAAAAVQGEVRASPGAADHPRCPGFQFRLDPAQAGYGDGADPGVALLQSARTAAASAVRLLQRPRRRNAEVLRRGRGRAARLVPGDVRRPLRADPDDCRGGSRH